MVDIPTGSINVRKLPGDRDGATHYVTEDDMIYLVERNRLNYFFYCCELFGTVLYVKKLLLSLYIRLLFIFLGIMFATYIVD